MPRATLLAEGRETDADRAFAELRIWQVPGPVPPSRHRYKYSLVYSVNGNRLVGYDNERGKGDHRHIGRTETACLFQSLERLPADFAADVERVIPAAENIDVRIRGKLSLREAQRRSNLPPDEPTCARQAGDCFIAALLAMTEIRRLRVSHSGGWYET